MNLNPEQEKELAQFPAALRTLIESELAAGNAIVEFGHTFPAPPVGAYCKLEKKVSTRPRASVDEIAFYERNSSQYSGEFTDAKRFYFVLEAPEPPPLPPDMDAIRKSHEPHEPSETPMRESSLASGRHQPIPRTGSKRRPPSKAKAAKIASPEFTQTETATSLSRTLEFQDKRPPHEIQFQLEADLMSLLVPRMDEEKLVMNCTASFVGAPYRFELRFESALPQKNCYSLRIETSWEGQPSANFDYYRNSFGGWFRFYTREFKTPRSTGETVGSAERYRTLCEAALNAEQHLDTVPALQQAIVAGMKKGGRFTTSHKEGGSTIYWRDGSFARSDYGDDPGHRRFENEDEFLKFLRQFYDWETSKNHYPNKVPDIVAWRLIFRLLRTA